MKALLIIALVVCAWQKAAALDNLDTVWTSQKTFKGDDLKFSSDDKYILIQNYNHTCVLESATGETVYTKIDMAYPVWFKDGKHFLALFDNTYFAIVETGTWLTIDSFPASGDVFSLSPDEHTIAVAKGNYLIFYDLNTKQKIKELKYFRPEDYDKPDLYPTLVKMIWSNDNRYLIYTSHDGQLHFWDKEKDTIGYTYGGGGGGSNLLVASRDGSKIAFKTSKAGIAFKIMDVNTKQIDYEFPGSPESIDAISFSPSGEYFAVTQGRLKVYKTGSLDLIREWGFGTATTVDFSNDSKHIITNAWDWYLLFNSPGIVSVKEDYNNEEAEPYPNPVKDILKLEITSDFSGVLLINIISQSGSVVLTEQKPIVSGINIDLTINVRNLPASVYTAVLQDGNKKRFIRFIKL